MQVMQDVKEQHVHSLRRPNVPSCVVSNLESDTVADQQTDLQVHKVQVCLQLSVGADGTHHLLPQAKQLPLLTDIIVPQFQQVGKLPHHRQRRSTGVHCVHTDRDIGMKEKKIFF